MSCSHQSCFQVLFLSSLPLFYVAFNSLHCSCHNLSSSNLTIHNNLSWGPYFHESWIYYETVWQEADSPQVINSCPNPTHWYFILLSTLFFHFFFFIFSHLTKGLHNPPAVVTTPTTLENLGRHIYPPGRHTAFLFAVPNLCRPLWNFRISEAFLK